VPFLPNPQYPVPTSPLVVEAVEWLKQHSTPTLFNHYIRSCYWSLLIAQKLPDIATIMNTNILETVVMSCIFHDMGWPLADHSLQNTSMRFEVDGANIARHWIMYVENNSTDGKWDSHRLQLVWDAIALHTTPSIVAHKEPEVRLAYQGIFADFIGPNGGLITAEEFREVVRVFPRLDFGAEGVKTVLCQMCRVRRDTTFDNFLSEFGKKSGLDTKGEGVVEFREEAEEKSISNMLLTALN
ncbi:metal dependent phosphohydrolase, partial [Leptodontidium sp. 2 PMI_412]